MTDLVMPYDQFVRSFSLRKHRLSWFLGAGASASGGIPTAWEMSWEFKAQIYASMRKIPAAEIKDISHPTVRDRIQEFISDSKDLPKPYEPDEYARLFEAAYPSASDRRDFLDRHIGVGKPSTGHIILALMMRDGIARVVWTTNFDVLIEDAFAVVGGSSGGLTTATLDSAQLANQAVSKERWPLYGKIHGDFRSDFLKNSPQELAGQNDILSKELVAVASRTGLVVTGYSGRDDSVMNLLESTLNQDQPYPSGLFWTLRAGEQPYSRVQELLRLARSKGVEAYLVPIQSFDELMYDLANFISDFDMETVEHHCAGNQRWSAAPEPEGKNGYPIIRLNAVLVEKMPEACSLVKCEIGGHKEIQSAIDKASAKIIATRKREGVLAFGSDAELRRVFTPFGLSDVENYELAQHRMRYDSQERGLISKALATTIAERLNLTIDHSRSRSRLRPSDPAAEKWKPLRKATNNPLTGSVPKTVGLTWYEGIELQLDWADDSVWLLIEPRILFDGLDQENRHAASSHAREMTFNRYNQSANSLIDYWTKAIAGKLSLLDRETELASFQLHTKSGHSWRAQS